MCVVKDLQYPRWPTSATVLAVNVSRGGLPKRPVGTARVDMNGLCGDGHEHEKHCRPDRAVSIQDIELLDEIRLEGFPVAPGLMGENLTVRGLGVQTLSPGDRLVFTGGPVLELTQARKPCYVLDQIDPKLKEIVVGRCGFLARVVQPGDLQPGQSITVERGGLPPCDGNRDKQQSADSHA